MAFTRQYAKVAAGLLSKEAAELLRAYKARTGGNFSEAAVNEVIELGYIEKTTNLLTKEDIWVLTPNGKKVAEWA